MTYSSLTTPATAFDYDMRARTLTLVKREAVLGGFDPAHYVTERIHATRERERMLGELQAVLAEVRKLSNLLPICAWCKKIRNDQGYWDQLEGYLATNAGIVFSHGVCPECAAKVRAEGENQAP